MSTAQEQATRELATRKLEEKYRPQRESLLEFMKFYWREEKKEELMVNWHIEQICETLEAVYAWEIKRLIINMPPRSLKTELISKAFPVWMMGNQASHKVMEISYSAELAEGNSQWARNMYKSDTYAKVFPRAAEISEDQDTKKHRTTVDGAQYYAAGSSGTITGIGADTIIIDDPLKPTDADSDVVRVGVNNNYDNTIKSRLNDRAHGAIIIVMQRLHDDDLCWHLMEREKEGYGDEREKLIIPAIGIADTKHYKSGQSFFETRFPIDMLQVMKKESPVVFSTQYQQDPVSKETQEFHEEWFRYYTQKTLPKNCRVFTTCDPAFSKSKSADNTAIITAAFDGMDMYVLEVTAGKYNPAELIDKLIYHYAKRKPEKIGIEAFQAQQIIWFNLKAELLRKGHSVQIEDIRQTGDKETKIRKLIPLYRNGHIYHTVGLDAMETELKRFPRGRHDDMIDAMQMLYTMYEVMPNAKAYTWEIKIEYDNMGRPIMVTDGQAQDIF